MELHIDQIARRLDLPRRKIERWIRQGRIPLVQVGSTCSFHREALERWAAEHNLTLCLDDASPAAACSPKPAMPSLRDAMADGGVHAAVPGADGPAVLREAVDRLGFLEAGGKSRLLEKLLEREQLTSTGIGKGIAIPHPRDPLDEWLSAPRIATFFLERPVDYRSLDDQPVFVLFMLLCPTVKVHLHLLSRLSFCLRMDDFIAVLRSGPSEAALIRKVAALEARIESASRAF
jgi:PTS system nitrogen regulatory IIA component